MNKGLFAGFILLSVCYVAAIFKNADIKADRDEANRNVYSLLDEIYIYKTKDSLNAANAYVISLKLKDYERYREQDAELIKTLQTQNRKLQSVISVQSNTINEIKGKFIRVDSIPDNYTELIANDNDEIRCIEIKEQYFELSGCINEDGDFMGVRKHKEDLLLTISTKYKRFLGFLWYTNKIENEKIDVVSRVKETEIYNVDFVRIK